MFETARSPDLRNILYAKVNSFLMQEKRPTEAKSRVQFVLARKTSTTKRKTKFESKYFIAYKPKQDL